MLDDTTMPHSSLLRLAAVMPWWMVPSVGRAQTPDARSPDAHAALRAEVVHGHASWCHHLYDRCEQQARALQRAVAAFLAEPDAKSLAAARKAWREGRAVYGKTEALRFHGGPIDAVEGYLNAWPVDEAFLDAVQGRPDAGIVHDAKNFPNLAATVLLLANERGGEANVSVGWHAIEFLLWGQDLSPDGPGDRPASDYVVGVGRDAARRREYLTVVTALLVQHLGQLKTAWAPDAANYRATFVADPPDAVRRMLTGALVLSAFELTGERLAVAYETQDQEQEHSCFSDTTWFDFEADQLGIQAIFVRETEPAYGPGLLALIRAEQPALATDLDRKLADTLAKLRAIPQPFDAAMRGADDAPGRVAMRVAMAALDAQSEVLTIVGRVLGYDLPLKPGG